MSPAPKILCFGAFEADLDSGELRKQGMRVRLPHQAFRFLTTLLERPGDLVTRDELRSAVWASDTFVDFDHGLNKAVNKLRQVMNDSAHSPRFIETVAKRGYRFIAPVTGREQSAAKVSAVRRIRLAVLPFENLSPDPSQEFFSDGLTDEMITELGRLNPGRLGVIARTSAMRYKRTAKRVDEIGRELGVDYILEGSVRRAENRIRITSQLIQVKDQTHLWAESYNRELADVFHLQAEVAHRVASSLAFELLPGRVTNGVSPQAYDAYLKGLYSWNQGTDAAAWNAIELFRQAIALHPRYALAYSAIADCYGRLVWFGALRPDEACAKAREAALSALEIDQELGEAHCSLALVHFWFDWNWSAAEHEFRRAISLKPNYAAAHNWYAAYLNVIGRHAEARAEQARAEEWDPLSVSNAMTRADPYYFSRQYASAIQELEPIVQREPHYFPAEYNLARAYALMGDCEKALEAFKRVAAICQVPQAEAAVAYAYALTGNKAEAALIEERIEQFAASHYFPAPQLALIRLGMGDKKGAVRRLQQGLEERSFLMIYVKSDPVYDGLREDPDFIKILKSMNFPD
ncbi:MAG: winged helix-turn-helix domain-containing protein [Acidobacteriaceae bacterium]|nr:winged helix-turn-helix domain-containing protein [Acidobacteriaceae bacterium]